MSSPTFAVTVNGVPLATVIETEVRAEINGHKAIEQKEMKRSTRSHIVTIRMRNHSGSRSGRGRVIFSRVGTA